MTMSPRACEYVADERALAQPGTYDITDAVEGVALVLAYLRRRLTAVFDAWEGRPVLMLSGGIDSILIAGVAAELRDDVLALTFQQPGSAQSTAEGEVAATLARQLGLDHDFVQPAEDAFREIVKDTVTRLDNADPWEVLAGTILVTLDRAAQERGASGPLLSGAGADALFLGGEDFDPGQADVVGEWDERMRAKIKRNFIRERFIPDFYERLLDDANRHIQVWQTHAATDLALRLHPSVIRGGKMKRDKALFRAAARSLGIPAELVSLQKNPMQVSGGGIDSIIGLARADLATAHGGKTYSDPRTEPLEFTVARLWLEGQRSWPPG